MITSANNTQVKNIISLNRKSGERKRHGLFVIEGVKMFSETPADRIERIYMSESFARLNSGIADGYNCAVETVRDEIFGRMSDTKTPQGILAAVRMMNYTMDDVIGKDTPLIVVLENIQDPGNLGTIIRSAEGAGASGVIMSADTVDIYNPKTVRSTMGSLYRVPFIYVKDLCSAAGRLDTMGIFSYAAHLDGSVNYYDTDYCKPTAIFIGNEGNGLTDILAKQAQKRIRIPMCGKLESLNAAVSASVILYEAARQRKQ